MDVLNSYRNSHSVSSDDDSEDSDQECTVWKRATTRRTTVDETEKKLDEGEEVKEPPAPELKPEPQPPLAGRKRKRNTVWSEVLQDQLISEDFEDCLLKNKPRDYGSRGKESYDYTLKYADPRSESDSYMSENSLNDEPPRSKAKHTASLHKKVKKYVKLDSSELEAARKINRILNEKKFYLIQRIVKTVGIEKAMSLLSMTQEIEDNGGMMIFNNTRRRTPGGVYIQLLKADKSVTQEMLDTIFEGEMSGIELKKFYAERKKNRKKKKKMENGRNKQNFNGSSDVPEGDNTQESNEVVPMEAEITTDATSEKSNLDNSPTILPVFNKSSENASDLEEGEIED